MKQASLLPSVGVASAIERTWRPLHFGDFRVRTPCPPCPLYHRLALEFSVATSNQATYHQAINHPPTTTMGAYQCLLCHPAVYVAADLGNMKSHLGAPTKHNMGPYRCQRAGCAQRNNREYAVNLADLHASADVSICNSRPQNHGNH